VQSRSNRRAQSASGHHGAPGGHRRRLLAANVDENTALELQSGELKAQQLILERRVDINRALLDASVDGIRLVDLEGRMLLANSVIEHLLWDLFGIPKGATLQEGAAMSSRLTDVPPRLRASHGTRARRRWR
jgi:PAS domain-containing protein